MRSRASSDAGSATAWSACATRPTRSADGRDGWVHKMTLGDLVIDTATAADSRTSGDDVAPADGFEEALRRYRESPRQFYSEV